MKIIVWKRIEDLGDGSSSVELFPTREAAYEGFDEMGFSLDYPDHPIDVYCDVLDISKFEQIQEGEN